MKVLHEAKRFDLIWIYEVNDHSQQLVQPKLEQLSLTLILIPQLMMLGVSVEVMVNELDKQTFVN